MNLFEKSSPPVSKPIGGIRISFTSEVMMLPKAAPMMTPTARSIALPLTANSLNSFNISLTQSSNDDVDELFWNDNHFANRLPGEPVLDFGVRQRGCFKFLVRRHNRHLNSITKL